MADEVFDDLTPEEEELLKKESGEAAPPAGDEKPADPAPADNAPTPAPPPPPAPTPTEDEEFQAWLKQHEGKDPTDIAKLAFQQSKRANRGEFQARRAGETLTAFQSRLAGALERAEARRAALGEDSKRFKDLLENDPDAATRLAFERSQAQEAASIDAEEDGARMDAAIAMARQGIPDFEQVYPEIMNFGEGMGYSKEELGGIRDGRDILMLEIGRRYKRLFDAGIIDVHGNLLAPPATVEATDPRLTPGATPITTLSSGPARTAAGAKTPQQQAEDLLKMSDEELERFEKANPGVFEDLIKTLG
jgi:hypothetical protein